MNVHYHVQLCMHEYKLMKTVMKTVIHIIIVNPFAGVALQALRQSSSSAVRSVQSLLKQIQDEKQFLNLTI